MQALTVFLIFLLQFIVLPFGESYFEVPKVFLGETAIFLLALMFFLKKNHTTDKFDKKLVFVLSSLFLLISVQFILFKSDTFLFGNQFRLQGAFLLFALGVLSLISSQTTFKSPRLLPIVSLFTLGLVAFLFGAEENGRAIGSLGEPNALAAAGIFLWPIVYLPNKNKLIRLVCLILIIFLIFITSSRSAGIAFIVQLAFIFLSQKISARLIKPTVFALLILLASFVLPIIKGGGLFENRLEIWQTAYYSGFENPIIGNGFGNIEKILPRVSQSLSNNVQYQYIDSSHNFLLDFWVQGGLIGLLLILFLIFYSFKKLIAHKNRSSIVILLGLLAIMSFNPVSVVALIQFWWIIGQSLKTDFSSLKSN